MKLPSQFDLISMHKRSCKKINLIKIATKCINEIKAEIPCFENRTEHELD